MLSPIFPLTALLVFLTFIQPIRPEKAPPAPTPSPSLLFVAELCRHGDRTPLAEFPNDVLPVSKWPEGVGKLTAIGQRAQYNLGTRLRSRYVDTGFLPFSFSTSDIYVRSTDIDRTLTSATSQMTGLYPPGTASHSDVRVQFGQDALHEDEGGLPHLIQPVPIHTTSRFDERLLLPGANCLRHDALMHQLYTSQQFRDKADAEKPFLQIAAKVAGLPPANFTFFNLEALSDTWTCNRAHHVPLPAGATPDVVEHARNLSNWLLTLSNTGLEVNRLRSGLLLHDIKSRMLMSALHSENRLPKSYNDQLRKFVLYSAHDTTVAAALASLQVFDGIYPSYNSTLIWELYKAADGTYLVRLEYNGAALTLPGCSSEYCPAAEYLKSTHERTIPGRVARDFECIIGWRRYASMISPPFWKTDDNELEGFGIFGDEGGSSGGFGVLQIAISIMAIILVIAVVRIAFRYQSKYSGYSRPKGDTIAANRRVGHEHMSLTDTPILM